MKQEAHGGCKVKLNLSDFAEQLRRFNGNLKRVRQESALPHPDTIRAILNGHGYTANTLNLLYSAGVIGNGLEILRMEKGQKTLKEFGARFKMSPQRIHDILSGRLLPDMCLEQMGYEKVEIWQKKK